MAAPNLPSATSNKKKFKPTDQQLIQVFLYSKINGIPLPSAASNNDGAILECDLYGEKSPWEIWEEFGGSNNSHDGKDLYFFTKLKRKSANGTRSVRTIGSGSWEGEDVGKPVMVKGTDQRIGLKKRYRFEKSRTSEDGAWIMHEYSIDSSMIPNHPENNYVLCRFRKNIRHNVTASEQETSTGNTSRQEVNKVTRRRKAIALGSANNDVSMGNDVLEGSKDQLENSNKSIAVAETTVKIVPNGNEQLENNDLSVGTNDQLEKEDNGIVAVETAVNIESSAVAEITVNIEFNDKEQLKDNVLGGMTWPELFSLQLKILNKDMIQDEDIPMLPNTFYNELLSHMREN